MYCWVRSFSRYLVNEKITRTKEEQKSWNCTFLMFSHWVMKLWLVLGVPKSICGNIWSDTKYDCHGTFQIFTIWSKHFRTRTQTVKRYCFQGKKLLVWLELFVNELILCQHHQSVGQPDWLGRLFFGWSKNRKAKTMGLLTVINILIICFLLICMIQNCIMMLENMSGRRTFDFLFDLVLIIFFISFQLTLWAIQSSLKYSGKNSSPLKKNSTTAKHWPAWQRG